MVDDTGNSNDAGNAGSTNEDGNDGAGQNDGQNAGSNDKKIELTQDELDKMFAERLTRNNKQWEKKFEDFKTEQKQAEELAKMNEADRKAKEAEIRENKLLERERAIELKETTLQVSDMLKEKGLPQKMAKYLIQNDAKSTNEKIAEFETEWKSALENAVNERLKGKTLETGTRTADLSSNPYSDMGWNETAQGVIERNDPDKAKALKSQVLADPKNTMFRRYNK